MASSAVTFAGGADTLDGAISATAQSIVLDSASGFPTGGGRILIGSEQITYGAISTATLTGCERGVNGTTAASHSDGVAVTCCTLSVTDSDGHGALENDFVTFSGAATLGGVIIADVLNQEYQVTHVVSATVFQIEARNVATIPEITTTSGFCLLYTSPSPRD